MIISHEHKFIFLKTKKTAGTAIEAALSELCGPSDVITPYREESEQDRKGLPPQNYRIEHPLKPKRPLWRKLLDAPRALLPPERRLLRAHAGLHACAIMSARTIWRSYFKFAFDRNPWDRQVSWYLYKTKTKRVAAELRALHGRAGARAYVDNHEIYMLDGALAVDFVGRYERLEEDLIAALAKAGVAGCGLSVPHTNATPNKDTERSYRSYYSDRTRERVADWYRPEIALLGYGF